MHNALRAYQEDKQFEQMLIAHYQEPRKSTLKLLFKQSEKLSEPKKEIGKILESEKE
jgi:hypothetical protein